MGTSIHTIINNEFEKRQQAAINDLETRKNGLYSKIPMLEDLDRQILLAGVKYNKMILLGTSPVDTVINDLQAKLSSLRREKEQLIVRSGYPANYLEPWYQCPNCSDTGYVKNGDLSEKCPCYKQLLIDLIFNKSNIKLAGVENFETFNENYYSARVNVPKYDLDKSPRENIVEIKEECLRFIENFRSTGQKNLLFCGPTGTGKTFMANCIAAEIIKAGYTVLYQQAPTLFSTINEYKMKAFKEDGFQDDSYKYIFDAELLIIDDLGTEAPTAARYADLLTILNTRQMNNLSRPCKTIISTNITIKKLHEYYDERVISRILGHFDMFMFAGEDIRSIKVREG